MKLITVAKNLSVMFFLLMGIMITSGANFMQTSAALYVDTATGSDSNNGSSITTAFKTIQKAVNTVQPGMTIYIRAGTYNENIVVGTTGTASAPITLTHYASDSVTINGGSNPAISTSGAVSYWILDGLTIKALTSRYTLQLGFWGTPETTYWTVRNNTIFGANYVMGSYHTWQNNNISGAGYTGTNGDAGISDGNDSHNNTYNGNTIHDFTGTDARGIWTQGKTHDNLIENNTVYNINTASGLGQCIDLDGAGNVEWRQTVHGNHVSNCSYVGIQLENVFASTIENNIITGGNAGIIVISYDAGVGCATGGESNQYGDTNGDKNCQGDPTNDVIRQNVVTTTTNWGWGYGGIMDWYAGSVNVWGNTITAASSAGNGAINFQGTAQQDKGASIKSNIVTQGSGNAICATDLASIATDSNNLLYGTGNNNLYATGTGCSTSTYSLAQYQSATGKGQNSLSGNPMFKNASSGDLHLTSASPAIDHGVSVGETSDPDGCARPTGAGYDMGAYEYGSVVSPTATVAPTATSVVTNTPTTLAPTNTLVPTTPAGPTSTPVSGGSVADVAIGKAAIQSSTYQGNVASRAVDGNTDGVLADNSVSHTGPDAQAWWQLDLGSSYAIKSINIWNRTDCCDWRLTNFYVFVSDSAFTSTDLNTTINQAGVSNLLITTTAGRPSSIGVNRSGRYVRVQLSGADNLQLAEVEVMASSGNSPTATPAPTLVKPTNVAPINTSAPTQAPTNTAQPTATATKTLVPTAAPTNTPLPTSAPTKTATPVAPTATAVPTATTAGSNIVDLALGKIAIQSSTYQGNVASRAVDGITDGVLADNSVSHTGPDAQAWWQVDLGGSYTIQYINLWNRTDCCDWRLTNFYVFVSDSPFASNDLNSTINQAGVSAFHYTGTAGRPSTVTVNHSGRYVRVQLTGSDNLQLAEVQVMGSPTLLQAAKAALIVAPSATQVPTSQPTVKFTPTNLPAATKAPATATPIVPTATATKTPIPQPTATQVAPTQTPTKGK